AQASDGEQESPKPAPSKVRLAIVVGLAAVVAMAALASWFGFHAYQSHQADQQRKLYVQVARQGAINLTTIDWEHVDTDIERILNSATGTFYDDFQRRSKPFIQVVQHFQSKSVGTITAAALESESDDAAQVLVAVSVKTTTAAAPEQRPRAWRMRITVQQVGDEAKVANVEFVP
ncbi:Mce protein, partial [Mycobacterium marinum]